MSENMIPFVYGDGLMRAVIIDGDPLFVGKDVAERLGYSNAADAISKHCKGVAKRYPLSTPGGTQEVRVLSEPDVLRLIIRSKLPEAEQFERWVFEEVLPSIRKTGSYRHPGIPPERDTAQWSASFARVVHAYNSEGGQEAARSIRDGAGIPFPMPCLAAVLHLMEASLGTEGLMRVSRSTSRRAVSSRHNGALGGRPRKGETAAQARSRRFYVVEKEIVPSDDGTETTVYTYSTSPNSSTDDADCAPMVEKPVLTH